MSDPLYWVAREGVVQGPYTLLQVLEIASFGGLKGADHLCVDGTEDWVLFGDWVKSQYEELDRVQVQVIRLPWNGVLDELLNYARGPLYPLKQIPDGKAQEVVRWLTLYYPHWNYMTCDLEGRALDPRELFDQWIAPAVARLYPDLIKSRHKVHFGPGRKWRILE